MGTVTLDRLTPGMKLAADVKDRTGRVILAAGSSLTEKHLRIFRMWGITQADVEGVDARPEQVTVPVEDTDILREAELRVRELFRHTDLSHPAVGELSRLSTMRLVSSLTEGGHGRQSA